MSVSYFEKSIFKQIFLIISGDQIVDQVKGLLFLKFQNLKIIQVEDVRAFGFKKGTDAFPTSEYERESYRGKTGKA